MSGLGAAFLLVAGVLAGVVGTAGGITSLVSYPALLAVGLHPLPASVANVVAVVACWPGAAVASRPELSGQGALVGRIVGLAAVGGAAGAVLLLSTPPGLFDLVVPVLVLAAAAVLVAEPVAARRRGGGLLPGHRVVLPLGLVSVSAYNAYFGAGAGVMTLAVVQAAATRDLPTANALKNMVVGGASLVSAAIFAAGFHVAWVDVAPLAAGMLAGSLVGPRLARRLPPAALRLGAATCGVALAAYLAVAAW